VKMGWLRFFEIFRGSVCAFKSPKLGLVIEIDGSSQNGREEYDQKRDAFLTSKVLTIYRISDFRVKHDLNKRLTRT